MIDDWGPSPLWLVPIPWARGWARRGKQASKLHLLWPLSALASRTLPCFSSHSNFLWRWPVIWMYKVNKPIHPQLVVLVMVFLRSKQTNEQKQPPKKKNQKRNNWKIRKNEGRGGQSWVCQSRSVPASHKPSKAHSRHIRSIVCFLNRKCNQRDRINLYLLVRLPYWRVGGPYWWAVAHIHHLSPLRRITCSVHEPTGSWWGSLPELTASEGCRSVLASVT